MSEFDHEHAAKEDICARPDVTGSDKKAVKEPLKGSEPPKEPLKISMADQSGVPDDLEKAAGKVISKSIDDLKVLAGIEPDSDFTALLGETLCGVFASMRALTNKPWLRFVVAGGALGFAFLPPACRYMAAKAEKEQQKEKDKGANA